MWASMESRPRPRVTTDTCDLPVVRHASIFRVSRRLSVSKQAAAKTVAVLEQRGYVVRAVDPLDAHRKRLQVTGLGFEVMSAGEAVFDESRDKWKQKIGAKQLERLEADLATLVGVSPVHVDTPGWIANSLDETT